MTKRTPRGLLAAQILTEFRVACVPWSALLGMDIGDVLDERIRGRCETIAAQLRSDADGEVAGTVQDIMTLLWPDGEPPHEWWQTPLGQACAASLGHSDAQSVTRSVAAAMLGVHPGTVAQMVQRGTLDRHPDGHILRSSVLLRIAGGTRRGAA